MSYGKVLAHPTSRTLFSASTASILGDWAGFAALVVLAFERSGSAIGPAALFTVQGVSALVATTTVGPWLDRVDRRAGIVIGYFAGAVALVPAILFGGLWPLYVAAALIGGVRPLTAALRHAVAGNDLPSELLGPTIALEGAAGQLLVGIGLALGGTLVVAVGDTAALLLDLVTFLFAGAIATRLPSGRGERDDAPRTGWRTGHEAWMRDPTTRRLGLLLVTSAMVGALPEALAPLGSGGDAWLPFVLAAQATGTALGSLAAGLTRQFEQPAGLMALTIASAVALAIGALLFDLHPAALGGANLLFGLAFTYTITARTAFTRAVDPARLGAAVASAITLVMLAEAVGSLALAAIAEAFTPGIAYLAAAGIVMASGVTAACMGTSPTENDHPVSR